MNWIFLFKLNILVLTCFAQNRSKFIGYQIGKQYVVGKPEESIGYKFKSSYRLSMGFEKLYGNKTGFEVEFDFKKLNSYFLKNTINEVIGGLGYLSILPKYVYKINNLRFGIGPYYSTLIYNSTPDDRTYYFGDFKRKDLGMVLSPKYGINLFNNSQVDLCFDLLYSLPLLLNEQEKIKPVINNWGYYFGIKLRNF